jgi:hypothetical protein
MKCALLERNIVSIIQRIIYARKGLIQKCRDVFPFPAIEDQPSLKASKRRKQVYAKAMKTPDDKQTTRKKVR